ncbi:MAG TPA: glycosyltransferase [Granulicella sp.]|nr:glycosyltransferase [Granulicella sp.]
MPHALTHARPIVISEIEQLGGAERSLLALSGWLHLRGHAHYLLTYVDHCNLAQYATHPLTIIELKPGPGARRKTASLKQHFQQRGASRYAPLVSGYQPALHATLAGLREFHCLMHDTPALFGDQDHRSLRGKLRISLANRIVGWGLRSGGAAIVTSEFLRAECRGDFGVEAHIARMGGLGESVSVPRIRPVNPAGTVDRQLRMLSVCRIEANKRVDWMLRSLAALQHAALPLSSRVDWRLEVAGKGSQIPALQEMAASLGISGRVHFHGFVSDEQLEALYDRAHLFLMPAIQGYGIPAIESLQRGIPVLLHRQSGVSDILLDTEWATVLAGDESTMLPAMREAIDKVIEGRHHRAPQPTLPSEDQWAERVAQLCRWV